MEEVIALIDSFIKDTHNDYVLRDLPATNLLEIQKQHQLGIKTNVLFVIYFTSTYREWKTTIINELGISISKNSTDNPIIIPWEFIKAIELKGHSLFFKSINHEKNIDIDKHFFSIENKVIPNIVNTLNKLLHIFSEVESNNKHQHNYFSDLESPNDKFDRWLIESFDYVRIGDCIFQYYNSDSLLKTHKSKVNGFIEQMDKSPNIVFVKNKNLYKIYRCEDDFDKFLINFKVFENKPEIIIDQFSKTKNISWKSVSSNSPFSNGVKLLSNDNRVVINLRFFYYNNCDYIAFEFYPKELKLQRNDSIEILFQRGKQVKYLVNKRIVSTENIYGVRIFQFKSKLSISELDLFGSEQIVSLKITQYLKGIDIYFGERGGDPYYLNKKSLCYAIINFARDYKKIVLKEIANYEPLQIRQENRILENNVDEKECYVYLMEDISNNFFKIGISNKPEYREYTLQSEKPTIKLLKAKKFPIRKIASSFEKALHESYGSQRVRGEWFNLSNEDVNHILMSLE